MADTESSKQAPYCAYSRIRRIGDDDDRWLVIGIAFPHADGAGFNIFLDALPLDGMVILRSTAVGRRRKMEDAKQPPKQ